MKRESNELPLEYSFLKSILTAHTLLKVMRGRWAAAAVGASVARSRAGAKENQQAQAAQAKQQTSPQQIEAQQANRSPAATKSTTSIPTAITAGRRHSEVAEIC